MTKNTGKKKRSKRYEGVLADKLVRQFLLEVAGEHALNVFGEITEPLSDEDLARECELKVSEVRSVLNKLHNFGIVEYVRTRDKDSGWYSYTWQVNEVSVDSAVKEKVERDVGELERKLEYEKNLDFFKCKRCKGKAKRMNFENASDLFFKCNRCGNSLKPVDNSKDIEKIERKLERLIK